MNRREMFKALAAGAAALFGLKGFAAREPRFIGAGTLHVTEAEVLADGFVMGEQARWSEGLQRYDEMNEAQQMRVRPEGARVVAAKIDGKWVDTSTWTPEQVAEISPSVLKRFG